MMLNEAAASAIIRAPASGAGIGRGRGVDPAVTAAPYAPCCTATSAGAERVLWQSFLPALHFDLIPAKRSAIRDRPGFR
ncbi:hypothetical protein GCM10017083_35010 [Thalassobaculum fulvum]|uniref:Uncharacterized protein n=1 Tax=Thalassobaculum fulvum TaxID=1633335 RepID=A0A918XUE9_9PROT|nr:hypothetical protein GCM10017083_35010 [Thalassobaculum fulvum]